jgi:hypothetical protein
MRRVRRWRREMERPAKIERQSWTVRLFSFIDRTSATLNLVKEEVALQKVVLHCPCARTLKISLELGPGKSMQFVNSARCDVIKRTMTSCATKRIWQPKSKQVKRAFSKRTRT